MDRIDRSLDDIIAAQKEKKLRDVKKKQKPLRVPNTGRVSKLSSRGVCANVSGSLALAEHAVIPSI